jgi:hypothetical protein
MIPERTGKRAEGGFPPDPKSREEKEHGIPYT